MTDAPDGPVVPAADEAGRGRRWFRLSIELIAAGAALLLLAGGRPWSTTTVGGGALPTVTVVLDGADVTPSSAVAVLALAGLAGLAATRRRGRLVIGALLVLAGAAIVDTALVFATSWSSSTGTGATIRNLALERVGAESPTSTTATGWWTASLAAGLMVAAGGVVTLRTSGSWPEMGRRYERRAGADVPARAVAPKSAWDQLDEGVDPTAGPGPHETEGTPDGTADDTAVDTGGDPTLRAGGDS